MLKNAERMPALITTQSERNEMGIAMRSNIIETAQGCWDYLTGMGVVRPQDYDEDFVAQLRGLFSMQDSEDFYSALDRVELQELIEGMFSLLEPVSAMMSELLEIFSIIQATESSGSNLRVRFDFGGENAFDFDLDLFREWEATMRSVLVTRSFWKWEQCAAWEIVRCISSGLAEQETGTSQQNQSDYPMSWPVLGTSSPVSGVPALDQRIAAAWRMRERFLADVSSRWPVRADYREGSRTSSSGDEAWIMVSDFWDDAMSRELNRLAVRGAASLVGGDCQSRSLAPFLQDLDDTLGKMPTFQQQIEESVQELSSLLSLPMWGKRHELYAAWIFCRIVDAIGLERLSFEVNAGRFSFDFKGTQLATFDSVDGPLAVWTELRTPYDRPVGHGRTRAIQPDYRVVWLPSSGSDAPINSPKFSILAIEVKQYKRSALRNPADALADYTGALPAAHVVLAAYGPVSSNVLKDLSSDASARSHVIRFMRPGRGEKLEEFRRAVASQIPLELSASFPPDSELGFRARERRNIDLELTWSLTDADLDLRACMADGRVVSFKNMIAGTVNGSVTLEEDIRKGPGPEILHITTEEPLDIYIHSYSGHGLGEVGARLRVVCGSLDEAISLRPSRSGEVWCRILSVSPHQIEIVKDYGSTEELVGERHQETAHRFEEGGC